VTVTATIEQVGEPILLTPGPAGTTDRVRRAMLRGDLCHREPEFAALLLGVRAALVAQLGLARTHEAIVVTGSGTAAVEMALASSVRPGRSVLVVDNGVYGDRMVEIARAHGLPHHVVTPPGAPGGARWTTPIDPEAVRAALARHPDIDAVACVHHETTTGLLNPVEDIGAVVAETDALLVLDAISSTANEGPDLDVVGADVICGSSNKGLHGMPGLSFALCSDAAIARFGAVERRTLYLDAVGHLTSQRAGEPLFTPAVQVLYALDEALAELGDAGGPAGRRRLYRERAAIVRAGFDALGLELIVAPEHRSSSVSTLRLPAGTSRTTLHAELKARGYIAYAAQRHLADDHIRICTFGDISRTDLERLEPVLGEALRVASPSGASA